MGNQRELEKLVNILKKETSRYTPKQIRSAIISEGYSAETANEVVKKLYPQKDTKPKIAHTQKEGEETKHLHHQQMNHNTKKVKKPEIKAEKPTREKEEEKDYYKEVNYLLSKLKEINTVKKLGIKKPDILKNSSFANFKEEPKGEDKEENINKSDIEQQIELKKDELQKIKIESGDDLKIVSKDGKLIDLNTIPRRNWRQYRDKGKTIAETKEEKMQKIRTEIYTLKRKAGRSKEVEAEEQLSKRISNRVKQKVHVKISERRLDLASKSEAEKLREKYQNKEVERKDFDTAVENIYTQIKKNPGTYDDEKQKDEKGDKKETKKKENTKKDDNKTNPDEELNLNLDTDSGTDKTTNSDIGNEFDLGLNLNLDDKK